MQKPSRRPGGQGLAYYPALTALRGLFILSIVIFHIGDMFGRCFGQVLGVFYTYGGYLGNYFFFLLSGFLLGGSYREKIAAGHISFFAFLRRRLIKIYPLYILTNLYMLFLKICTHSLPASGNWRTLLKVALTTSWGWFDNVYPYNLPTWFVSILLQCWIVYYCVARLSAGRPALYRFLTGALSLWGCLLIFLDIQAPFCYSQNGEGFLNFFLGVGLYEAFYSIQNAASAKTRRLATGGAALWVLLLCGVCGCCAHFLRSSSMAPAAVLLICTTAIACALFLPPCRALLETPVLRRLGSISASVYFWHSPLAHMFIIVRNRVPLLGGLAPSAQFILYWILLPIVGWLSYCGIERPISGGRERL